MEILVKSHSGLRWVVLILLVAAIFNAVGAMNKGKYEKKDKMLNLFTMVSLHTQLLLGLILYFVNHNHKINFTAGWMKDAVNRFYGMEHILMMLIAIVLVTIGRKKAEKAEDSKAKHKKIVVFYTIALLLILAAIPWPFRNLGGSWF